MLDTFLSIAAVTSAVVIVVMVGLFSVRWGYFPKEGVPYLGKFSTHIALPCALFIVLATQDFADIFNPGFFWAYGLGSLATVGLLAAWYGVTGRSKTEVGMAFLGGGVNNCMMVGLPIAAVLLGPEALLIMGLVPLFQDVVLMTSGIMIADMGQGKNWRASLGKTFQKIIRTPLIIGVVAGAVYAALPIGLPVPAEQSIRLFAGCLAGVGLFMLGGVLAHTKFGGIWSYVVPMVAVKLIVHPVLVALAFWLFPVADKNIMIAGIFAASLPMIGGYAAIAHNFGPRYGEQAAVATLVGTVLSFVTIAITLTLLL